VDLDIAKFFDHVPHDVLMGRIRGRDPFSRRATILLSLLPRFHWSTRTRGREGFHCFSK